MTWRAMGARKEASFDGTDYGRAGLARVQVLPDPRQVVARAGERSEDVALRAPASVVPLLGPTAGGHRERRVGGLEDLELVAAVVVPAPGERSEGRPPARLAAPRLDLTAVLVSRERALRSPRRDQLGGSAEQLLGA